MEEPSSIGLGRTSPQSPGKVRKGFYISTYIYIYTCVYMYIYIYISVCVCAMVLVAGQWGNNPLPPLRRGSRQPRHPRRIRQPYHPRILQCSVPCAGASLSHKTNKTDKCILYTHSPRAPSLGGIGKGGGCLLHGASSFTSSLSLSFSLSLSCSDTFFSFSWSTKLSTE